MIIMINKKNMIQIYTLSIILKNYFHEAIK